MLNFHLRFLTLIPDLVFGKPLKIVQKKVALKKSYQRQKYNARSDSSYANVDAPDQTVKNVPLATHFSKTAR